MEGYAQVLTHYFAVAMMLVHICIVLMLVYRVSFGRWVPQRYESFVRQWALPVAAAFPVAGFFLSLWYSEVVGLPVCVLCWFTRTMIYPLAFILPIAAWRKDTEVWRYALPLSLVGMLISGYQHLMQMGIVEGGVCHALSGDTDCAVRYVFEFGYITLPLFGFTIFAVVALLTWIARERHE